MMGRWERIWDDDLRRGLYSYGVADFIPLPYCLDRCFDSACANVFLSIPK
jgi:hypothetical protein